MEEDLDVRGKKYSMEEGRGQKEEDIDVRWKKEEGRVQIEVRRKKILM